MDIPNKNISIKDEVYTKYEVVSGYKVSIRIVWFLERCQNYC